MLDAPMYRAFPGSNDVVQRAQRFLDGRTEIEPVDPIQIHVVTPSGRTIRVMCIP
jgi:hypothetical protein